MPANLADKVLTVLGITTFNKGVSGLVTSNAKSNKSVGKPNEKYAPSKFVKQYNLQPLYDKGYQGQGQTVGIITFAG